MRHVLVVEDNENLAYGLKNNLEIEGYRVTVAADGATALEAARRPDVDLVILDLMIPEPNGIQVLRTLRAEGRGLPVLILTARGGESEKVVGLRLGADDYVTKPFSVLELLARVEALLRRAAPAERPLTVERFGAVEVNLGTREVTRDGEPVALAPKEFDLLAALLRGNGAIVSRETLMQEVWGYPSDVLSRTVDTHVGELRRKLEAQPSEPVHILTVRKAGYRLRRETED